MILAPRARRCTRKREGRPQTRARLDLQAPLRSLGPRIRIKRGSGGIPEGAGGGSIVRAKCEFEDPPARRGRGRQVVSPAAAFPGLGANGRPARFHRVAPGVCASPGRADLPWRFRRRGGPFERRRDRAAAGPALRDPRGPDALPGGDPGAVRLRQDVRVETSRPDDRTTQFSDRKRRRSSAGGAGVGRRRERRRGSGGDRERRVRRARSGASRRGLLGSVGRDRPRRRRSASRRESRVRSS